MAAVGSLRVQLIARTAKFTTGLKSAARRVGDMAKKMAKFGAAAAAAGLAATVAMTKMGLATVDATAKMADELALSTERLSAWQHGAGLAGVSAETLNSSIARMVRRVGLFAEGTGAAAKRLKQLGFAQDVLNSKSTGEQFRLIADELAKLPTHAERSAAAFEIFGRQGQQLLPILQGGAAGLSAIEAEADRLGLTFGRVDAAKVEAANDAIARMGALFTGLTQQLAIKLAPFIDTVAKKFTDLAATGDGMGKRVSTALGWVATGIGVVGDGMQIIRIGFKFAQVGIVAGWASVARAVANVAATIESLANMLPGVEVEFTGMADTIADSMTRSANAQWQEFQRLRDAPLPSTKIADFLKDIENQSTAAAEKNAAAAAARVAAAPATTAIAGAISADTVSAGLASGLAAAQGLAQRIAGAFAGGPARPAAAAKSATGPQFAGLLKAGTAEAFRAVQGGNASRDPITALAKLGREQLRELEAQTAIFKDAGSGIATMVGLLAGPAAIPS